MISKHTNHLARGSGGCSPGGVNHPIRTVPLGIWCVGSHTDGKEIHRLNFRAFYKYVFKFPSKSQNGGVALVPRSLALPHVQSVSGESDGLLCSETSGVV